MGQPQRFAALAPAVFQHGLAAARRKVDVRSSQEGLKETAAKLALAQQMLAEAQASGENHHELLSSQLEAVGSDENFMVED